MTSHPNAELIEYAEGWKQDALDMLQHPGVHDVLGGVADQIADEVSDLMVSTIHPETNMVELPIHRNLSKGCFLIPTLPIGQGGVKHALIKSHRFSRDVYKYPLDDFVSSNDPRVRYMTFSNNKVASIIALPVKGAFSHTYDRGSILGHEIGHRLQRLGRLGQKYQHLTDTEFKVACEAEAHAVIQYTLLDVVMGGLPGRIVYENKQRYIDNPLLIDETPLRITVSKSEDLEKIRSITGIVRTIGSVLANEVHGYIPGSDMTPSADLIQTYRRRQFIR